MSRVPSVIQAPTPAHVQTYYCTHTRSNRSNIEATVRRLLGDSADQPLRRLPEHGDLAIPRPHRSGGPKFWVVRISGQLSQGDQDTILEAARKNAVVKEKVQARLDQVDRKTCLAHKASNDRFRSAVDQGKLDLRGLSPSDFQDVQVDHVADFFRFGQLATCSAITQGQSEKLHMDNHDDRRLYTTLLVLGRENLDWDHTDGRPGLLPHRVVALKPEDAKKRVVITMFTCEPTTDYLDMQGIMLPHLQGISLGSHSRRKHGEDRFTAEEMAETGLWVCSCGKVTVSERGLSHHRKRYPSHHV
ncbi:uncharacterized protein L199_006885 [Kwoniella botswanensis]|uniref:uncharacterized protein n=1 Tax=Kwoniella botswanensis TaxID=1268659 RepID=UPI00315C6542